MKRRAWLIPLLSLFTLAVGAEVYKWIDDQGNVHYGDLPPEGGAAEPLILPGLSTYQSAPPPSQAEPAAAAPDQAAEFTGYTRVEIIKPEPGSAVRANDQKVVVVVALEPHLQEGHGIEILLDRNPVGEPYTGTAVELSGVFRGEHSLQARVRDDQGKLIAESPTTTFTLRQATIIKPTPLPR